MNISCPACGADMPSAMLLCLAMVLGWNYDFGGLYAEPGSVLPVLSLTAVLSGLAWLHYVVALVAYYSNRNAMRWSQSPGGAVLPGSR
ncbi:MAG TPA: hypothetical protein VNH11_33040 [Pirellulales bacterium]|nr:hypothetical protein [Pirellulales bacterium]